MAEVIKVENLVKKYSDYVRYPIKMMVETTKNEKDEEGNDIEGKTKTVLEEKTLNSMLPLWKKNKKEVTEVSADQHAANFDEYDYKSYNGSYYSFVPSNPSSPSIHSSRASV